MESSTQAGFVRGLQDEISDPLSHGAPIEGSITRLVTLLVITGYALGMLAFGFIEEPAQVEAAHRILGQQMPIMIGLTLAHMFYIWRRPDDRSTVRVFGTAVFDSTATTLCAHGGYLFIPFLALYPWLAMVYGVRFGHRWLTVSATLSMAGLAYLVGSGNVLGMEPVLPVTTMVILVLVAAYCHRLICRLHGTQRKLEQMATSDPLTGLPNRRLLLDRLAHAIALAPRIERDVAVLYFDIDHFKQVNDTLGHGSGDLLLIEIAQRVLACIRTSDTLSHIAGDEFVVILDGLTDLQDAERIGKLILTTIRNIEKIDGHPIRISASIGLAVHSLMAKQGATTAMQLLKAADHAMYAAKRAGKNRIALAHEGLATHS